MLKKIIVGILITALICGGAYGAMIYYRGSNKIPVNVYSVSEIADNTWFYFDDEQAYGEVVADRIQSVFLSDTQKVSEVKVTQGQQVKKGDVLFTYDSTLKEIDLEKKQIEYEMQSLYLEKYKENLDKINRLRPSAEYEGGEGGSGEGETTSVPEEPEEPEYYEPEETYSLIDGNGSILEPYRYLWSYDDILSEEVIVALFHGGQLPDYYTQSGISGAESGTDEGGSSELPRGDGKGDDSVILPDDTLASFILKDFFGVDVYAGVIEEDPDEEMFWFDGDDGGGITVDDEGDGFFNFAPEYDENEPIVDLEEDPYIPEEEYPIYIPDEEVPEEETEDDFDDIDPGEITTDEDNEGDQLPDNDDEIPGGADIDQLPDNEAITDEVIDQVIIHEDPSLIPGGSLLPEVYDYGDDMDVYIILEVHEYDNRNAPLTMKYGMHMYRVNNRISIKLYNPDIVGQYTYSGHDNGEDNYGEATDDAGDSGGYGGGGDYGDEGSDSGRPASISSVQEIDMDASYTAEQISEMRSEHEKLIRDTTINAKRAEIALREAKAEMGDGTSRSKLDGVVSIVRDPDDAATSGSAVVQVSAGGGYKVSFSLGELSIEDIQIGQEVSVMNYDNGEIYSGTVDEVASYPTQDGSMWGSGNPNSSYYPCTVSLESGAELQEYSFVSVTYQPEASTGGGLFIGSMFVRSEPGGNYVYAMDENGILRKRYVKTGRISDYAIEILGGIDGSDHIAFPYGADTRDGADTLVSTYEDLMEYA